jgi:hypothetical protein
MARLLTEFDAGRGMYSRAPNFTYCSNNSISLATTG